MPLTDQQAAFLKKHLGIALPSTGDEPATEKLVDVWRDAKERTDSGVSALQQALKQRKVIELDRIADAGLNGITDGNSVAMMSALMDYDASDAGARPAAKDKVLKQVDAYRSFLNGHPLIPLVEKNPFGVRVEIKAPLFSALDLISASVRR